MTEPKNPQERIAAARQLYATLRTYLERPTWTPLQGALILSGIHPPAGCSEVPLEGVGLDGQILITNHSRFSQAREIWKHWRWRCEDDEENGDITPTELSLYEFIRWCEDSEIETEWLRFFQDIVGYNPSVDQVDFVPSAVVEYATRTANAVDTILSKLEDFLPEVHQPEVPAVKRQRKSSPRSPMPMPENRDYLSTDEFAAVMGVLSTTIHKARHNQGHYCGVRAQKLQGSRLLRWPVTEIKVVLGRNAPLAVDPEEDE